MDECIYLWMSGMRVNRCMNLFMDGTAWYAEGTFVGEANLKMDAHASVYG